MPEKKKTVVETPVVEPDNERLEAIEEVVTELSRRIRKVEERLGIY
tara:strand:- start:948 stop:1085 length:138 start_codon:yes stop_codon:yes gene_type:complete